jgi:hypothetical protein
MSMLDLDSLREGLCDTFPAWSRWIAGVRIDESPKALPVDNDGRGIFYNQRLMRYYTPETQRFYLAQQLLHFLSCDLAAEALLHQAHGNLTGTEARHGGFLAIVLERLFHALLIISFLDSDGHLTNHWACLFKLNVH